MDTQLNVRIDEDLKKKLDQIARIEGKTSSGVVRELITEYIRDQDIQSYIDELWERIGESLEEEGVTSEDVESVIQRVRNRPSS